MAQASVLSDSDIRRVFRMIETTRYAERNRLAFMLSIYAGMRVGEIAALRMGDIANQYGEIRTEIKLAAHQTKGTKGPHRDSFRAHPARGGCIFGDSEILAFR